MPFTRDDDRQDEVLAMQPLEADNLLLNPGRAGGGGRAEHDQIGGSPQCILDAIGKVRVGGQFLAVAEDRGEALWGRAAHCLAADEAPGIE